MPTNSARSTRRPPPRSHRYPAVRRVMAVPSPGTRRAVPWRTLSGRAPRGLLWLGRVGGGLPEDAGVDQGAADIHDLDHADQAGVAGHRQVPEMATHHDLGCVTDAGRRRDDGRAFGHQLIDPNLVEVFAVRDR